MTIENYKMKDLGIESLVGLKVTSAKINHEQDLVILETDKGIRYLTWEGDCCAHCYLANVDGTNALIGATIESAENAEWSPYVEDSEDRWTGNQTMGTKIKTDKGYVSFETRLEHNGYYGGYILVNEFAPMNQYSSPRHEKVNEVDMTDLKDF